MDPRSTYHYVCEYCLEPFSAGRKNARFCSKSCYGKGYRGEDHHFYKGGSINKGGYLMVMHNGKDVLYHRLVAEEMIGRQLRDGEIVHHINGNKLDNRPENLEVCHSVSAHMIKHRSPSDEHGKVCTLCKQYKSLSLYHHNRTTYDGYQARCKECLKSVRKP